jgi:hypothetical protein
VIFPPHQQAQWHKDVRTATTRDKGHGRIEVRRITATTWRNDYLRDWPQVGQAFRLERERTVNGRTTAEVVYGITSLTPAAATAEQLLAYVRAHWGIENGRHHIRDETLREDRGRVRRGHAPQVLASLRNVAVHLRRQRGAPSLAAADREMAARPGLALAMLTAPASISE